MMLIYGGNYNAIDQLNKQAFGHVSIYKAISIKCKEKRVWFDLLVMYTLNAYHIYTNPWGITNSTVCHFEFIQSFADSLQTNR